MLCERQQARLRCPAAPPQVRLPIQGHTKHMLLKRQKAEMWAWSRDAYLRTYEAHVLKRAWSRDAYSRTYEAHALNDMLLKRAWSRDAEASARSTLRNAFIALISPPPRASSPSPSSSPPLPLPLCSFGLGNSSGVSVCTFVQAKQVN